MTNNPPILLIGTPNSGKSTLFQKLTGKNVQIGNFPGTTVEKHEASYTISSETQTTLVDIPGLYSLAAYSPDEQIAIHAILGLNNLPKPQLCIAVVDTPRLQRSLYLVLQLLELHIPTIVVLNMIDEARKTNTLPNVSQLERALQVPVVPIVAKTGEGLVQLQEKIQSAYQAPHTCSPGTPHQWPIAITPHLENITHLLPQTLQIAPEAKMGYAAWILLSYDSKHLSPFEELNPILKNIFQETDIHGMIISHRYTWIDSHESAFLTKTKTSVTSFHEKVDRILLRPLTGIPIFLFVMLFIFQALFSWSDPMIGLIETGFGYVGEQVTTSFDWGIQQYPTYTYFLTLCNDFIVSGLIAGVGAVVVFVPQIALLSLFIAALEDSGYLARTAYLMDRLLKWAGLPGRAFIPLLSGYACAVPAIMATRTMPRFRDRLLSMLVIPLTSCSARLPVYTLMISVLFATNQTIGWFSMQALVLMGLYLFSSIITLLAAVVLGKWVLPAEQHAMVLELPPYRIPHLPVLLRRVWSNTSAFLSEAGKIILVATIILWGLLSFPKYEAQALFSESEIVTLQKEGTFEEVFAQEQMAASYAGQIGQFIEPTIRPLGYDWRIGIGLLGSFAAREAFISTMGLVFHVEDAEAHLTHKMQQAKSSAGKPLLTPLVSASILVFFALAMQCISTLAVLKRETKSWKWPSFVFIYMTALAWIFAFFTYQGGRLLGFE
jgi:ferrous iron transport protein B